MIGLKVKWPPKMAPDNLFKRMERDFQDAMAKQVTEAMIEVERAIKEEVTRKFQKGRGTLRASFQMRPRALRKGKFLETRVTSNLIYARVQDLGAGYEGQPAIRAKPPLRMLAIPLEKRERRGGIWPRHYKGELFPLLSKKGNLLLMDKGSGEPKYLLKYYTWIKGKHYLEAAERRFKSSVQKRLGNTFKMAIGPVRTMKP